jgi:hypothetical protein
MSRSEANKKRAKAVDAKFETTTKEPEVKVEENTKKEKKPFLKFKTTPAERMTKLATLNARTYIFLKGMGIVNKKLSSKVNGEVMPNGKPWFNDKSATETKEEEKASPILNTVPTTTEVVKKDTKKDETTKKTESTQQDSVKTKQPAKEEKKDKEEPKIVEVKEDEIDYLVEPETEMERVLKPKKNYRKNGKKARKAAMEAAKKSA